MAIDPKLIDQLLTNYKKREDIIGENGLLKQLTKGLGSRDQRLSSFCLESPKSRIKPGVHAFFGYIHSALLTGQVFCSWSLLTTPSRVRSPRPRPPAGRVRPGGRDSF